jgi:hypothetical protein
MIIEQFMCSIYLLFSITLEEDTPVKDKTNFVIKWMKRHSKYKLAVVHSNNEDARLKYMNK